MSVSNSLVDIFQGNPFSNPVGSCIEKATDFKNSVENWTLIMETCDIINSTEDGPRLAIRAFKRRLTTDIAKNKSIVLYTLTLLETCVKNCGYRFHIVVCSRDFLQDLEKMVQSTSKAEVPVVISDRILLLIQTWFDSFRENPNLREIVTTYRYLRECGIEFPMTDLVSMSPIVTPTRSVQPSKSPALETPKSKPVQVIVTDTDRGAQSLPENFMDKLSKHLLIVQTNIDVMGALMRDHSALHDIPDEIICLMKNLEISCQQMQKRLVELINKLDEIYHVDASVLFDLLRVNDEMNSVLIQYERYERTRIGNINKKIPEQELSSRMAKSSVADVYAAQLEVTDFYEGFSRNKASTTKDDMVKTKIQLGLEVTKDLAAARSSSATCLSSQAHQADSFQVGGGRYSEGDTSSEQKKSLGLKSNGKSKDLFEL